MCGRFKTRVASETEAAPRYVTESLSLRRAPRRAHVCHGIAQFTRVSRHHSIQAYAAPQRQCLAARTCVTASLSVCSLIQAPLRACVTALPRPTDAAPRRARACVTASLRLGRPTEACPSIQLILWSSFLFFGLPYSSLFQKLL